MSTDEKAIHPLAVVVACSLGHGHEQAMQRAELRAKLNMSDRLVRRMLEEAGASGYLICNEQDGKGYYLAKDLDDVARQYAQEKARMKSLYRRMLPLRRALKKAGRDV